MVPTQCGVDFKVLVLDSVLSQLVNFFFPLGFRSFLTVS